MPPQIARRQFLSGAGVALLGGCAQIPAAKPQLQLPAVQASLERLTRITVCTRPFRPQGPRIETEAIAGKIVVHNYGHGGSGWSLSWGSGTIASELAMATGEKQVGVIGCGALGLTTALLLQRAGATVTIYAKDLPPNVRSSNASGIWSPDSRICLEKFATPAVKSQWERMCRSSHATFQSLLGLAGDPVEYIDIYFVRDSGGKARGRTEDSRPAFAEFQQELVPDLRSNRVYFAPGQHNLGARELARNSQIMFNISSYSRLLLNDFLSFGGKIEIREFHSAGELASLPQKTLVNCTGYGARALFGDTSIVPVRGQLAKVIPQPEVNYGLFYKDVSFLPRRDDLVFQYVGENDYYGFNDETTNPDHAEAERAITTIAGLFTA